MIYKHGSLGAEVSRISAHLARPADCTLVIMIDRTWRLIWLSVIKTAWHVIILLKNVWN